MRIAYITNVRLPSERAHGHQIAQVCDALAQLDHAVTIFAPTRKNTVKEDYWTYYNAQRSVQLMHVGSFDPIDHPLLPKIIQLPILNRQLATELPKHISPAAFSLVYTRSPALLPAALATRVPVVLELHQLPRSRRRKFAEQCNRCVKVACLTSAMRDQLRAWGVHHDKLMVEGDAVDLKRFTKLPSAEEARRHYGLPATDSSRLVIGYIGRLKTLGMEKGVAHILEALAHLKREHRFFGFIVGGPEKDCEAYKAMAKSLGLTDDDVLFTGAIPASDVPAALAACDILAMPFPDLPHYRTHMSPLKMFEYMAAERPIITSDLPTVRDVLSESTAIFCHPGDSGSLTSAMEWIADHRPEALARAARARKLVEEHTWQKRMGRILQSIA